MARTQFPHKSSALTASFRVKQPPNATFVLSCPSAIISCIVPPAFVRHLQILSMKSWTSWQMLMCLFAVITSWKIGDYGVLRSIRPMPTLMKKIGEWARFRCCNTLLFNHFRNVVPANLFKKMEVRTQWKYCLGHECLNQKMLSLHKNGIQRHRRLTELAQRHYNLS